MPPGPKTLIAIIDDILLKPQSYIFLLIIFSVLSFTKGKVDYTFFQTRKSTIDSSISGFQPSEKLYNNNFDYFSDKRFSKNKYYVRQFKSEYGDIFSDTLNGIIRYMLVQGDCEVWLYYTKDGQPFKIDFLKMFGGTVSYYLIDKNKMYVLDDNKNQSWCTRDTSSYKAELCLDRKKIIYYQRQGHDFGGSDTTRYLRQDLSQKKTRKYLLEKFERIKNGN